MGKTALEFIVDLTGLQAELATTVKTHEEAINDLNDRILDEDAVRRIVAEAQDPAEPWWARMFYMAGATVLASAVLALGAALSGHISIHW